MIYGFYIQAHFLFNEVHCCVERILNSGLAGYRSFSVKLSPENEESADQSCCFGQLMNVIFRFWIRHQ